VTLLEVDGLRRRFALQGRGRGRFLHAVDGVSFRLDRGEAVGLVGESGCGKSTLGRVVARLIDAEDGRILLDGRDIARVGWARFARDPDRASVQMVFQDAGDSLDPRIAIRHAIAAPLSRLTRLDAAARAARVAEMAELVGLSADLLDRYPHQLSGGQKARVGISRALGPAPRVLVLDEPTAALDVSVQALVLRLLDDLRRRFDLALLFISHDLNVVRLLCARVMVMYLGQIVETGPAGAVFDAPLHPYTAALVDAIPDPARRGLRGTPITGEAPGAIDPPPNACRFAERCPVSVPRCRAEAPVPRPVGPDRSVACHLVVGPSA
jgi:oligopeptide/dipeptide ABC transporter ATP-binding protein